MKRNTTRIRNERGRRGGAAALSATLLASMIMAGSASAYVYDDNAIVAPNTAYNNQVVVLSNGATLYPTLSGGSLQAGLGYNLQSGTVDNVSLNNGKISIFGFSVTVPANLFKTTSGTVTLIGTNNYTGLTFVNEGTLVLGDGTRNGELKGTAGVTISNDATLKVNIGTNTFSLKNGAGILNNGTLEVTNEAGQTTTLSGIRSAGGSNSVYSVSGDGDVILQNSRISADHHELAGGSETVDADSRIHANTILVGSTSSALLDVDGGSIADRAGTERSNITLLGDGSELRVRNGGSVLGNVAGVGEGTNVLVTDADSVLNGDVSLFNGSVNVSSGAEITGGWSDSVSIYISGDIVVENDGHISTGRIFLNDGDLDVSGESSVFTRRSIDIANGNLLASGTSSVRSNRSIRLNDGNLIVTDNSAVSARRNIELADGHIIARDSSIRAGRDIELLDGNLFAVRSNIRAGDDITLVDGHIIANESSIRAGDDITLIDGSIISNRSSIRAGEDITLVDGSIISNRSSIWAGEDITLVDGDIRANRSYIRAGEDITLVDGDILANRSDIRAGEDITLVRGNLVASNRSDIRAGEDITLVRGDINADRSDIRAGEDITLVRGDINADRSDIRAGDDITLIRGDINADRSDIRAGDDITLVRGDINAYRSDIRAGDDITLDRGDINADRSDIRAGDDITLDRGDINAYRSDIRAGDDITLNRGDISAYRSEIRAGDDVTLRRGDIDLVNSSLLAGQDGWGGVTVRNGDVFLDNSTLEGDWFYSRRGNVDVLNGSTIDARTIINRGRLVVDETSAIIGDTTILENALARIEGTIYGDVHLTGGTGDRDGGFLFGKNVTITGDLVSNGILSPGGGLLGFDETGTVFVGGDFYQGPGGSYHVDIFNKNNYDQIVVDGQAVIDGGDIYVFHHDYKPYRNDTMRVVDAADGVEVLNAYNVHHDFATDTMLQAKVRYNDDAVEIFIKQLSFNSKAKTPNQHAVAKALDKAAKRNQLDSLFDHLNYTNRKNIPHLLQLLSPEELTTIFNAGFANAQIQNINIERRLDDVRNGSRGFSANGLALSNNRGTINYDGMPVVNDRDGLSLAGFDGKKAVVNKEVVAPVIEESSPWGFFVTGSGEWADVESTTDAKGGDFASGGVTVGADYRLNDNFVVGVFGGYVHTTTDLILGGDIKANGGRGGLYGSYFNEGLYVNALASGGYNNYKINRNTVGGIARGKTDGGQFDALLGAGYDFSLGCVTLGPVGSLQYSYVGFDGFQEHDADGQLDVRKNSQDSLRTLLGAKAATCWNIGGMALRPEVRAQWKHEYLDREGAIDSSFTGSGALFTVHGPRIGRDSLVIDAGASLDVSETVSIYAYYTGELARDNYSSNSVNGGFRLSF